MNEFEKGLLRHFSIEKLSAIQKTRIGIAGCGGLGSNIANAMARSGFRDFEIIDHDVICASNLNRQNFYLDEIGSSKAEITAKRLKQVNPDISVMVHKQKLDKNNIDRYFKDRDIIFEAFDNADAKKLLLETFGNSGRLLIMGSGMAGIGNKTSIEINKVNDKLYIVGDMKTDVGKENPPLAPRVIACAALMASVALENTVTGK